MQGKTGRWFYLSGFVFTCFPSMFFFFFFTCFYILLFNFSHHKAELPIIRGCFFPITAILLTFLLNIFLCSASFSFPFFPLSVPLLCLCSFSLNDLLFFPIRPAAPTSLPHIISLCLVEVEPIVEMPRRRPLSLCPCCSPEGNITLPHLLTVVEGYLGNCKDLQNWAAPFRLLPVSLCPFLTLDVILGSVDFPRIV